MYMELTPEDTRRDLRSLLIDAIPGFEFPRQNLYNYTIVTITKLLSEVTESDSVIGVNEQQQPPEAIIENSTFNCELTPEEINILAILMKIGWLQRQVDSIENTRMKYSGADFKFTSQANHLSKLLSLLSEANRQSLHMQRLYKRRKVDENTGSYVSNWGVFGENSALG